MYFLLKMKRVNEGNNNFHNIQSYATMHRRRVGRYSTLLRNNQCMSVYNLTYYFYG